MPQPPSSMPREYSGLERPVESREPLPNSQNDVCVDVVINPRVRGVRENLATAKHASAASPSQAAAATSIGPGPGPAYLRAEFINPVPLDRPLMSLRTHNLLPARYATPVAFLSWPGLGVGTNWPRRPVQTRNAFVATSITG